MAISNKYTIRNNTYVSKEKEFETEIGDIKQSDFLPQLKLKRWNNECNFSVRYIDNELTTPEIKIEQGERDVIKYIQPKVESHFYDKGFGEGGGYEFELSLKEKPASNILEFSIQTTGLRFSDQGIWKDDNGKEITTYTNSEGKHTRPENVNGSYAVYHASKKNNQYKAGKAFHIYRPKITDANNHEIWGVLNIDVSTGTLTITIPSDFYANAVYPLIVDPTFGYTSIGVSSTFSVRAWAYRAQAPENGDITKLTVYWLSATGEAGEPAIYDDKAGPLPDNLLASGAEVTGLSDGWIDLAISLAITNGTWYWLAAQGDASKEWHFDANAGADRGSWNQTYQSWEDPHGGMDAMQNQDLSIYATYTAAGTTGDADITLPQFTVQGLGAATGVITLPQFTLDVQAHLPADASITLPQLSVQGGGAATGIITLPILTVVAASLNIGVFAENLPQFTTFFAGHLQTEAALTLPLLTVASTDVPPATATLTLPIFATDFAGHLQADGAVTLPQLTVQGGSGASAELNLPLLTVESFTAALANITLPQVTVAGTSVAEDDTTGDSSLTLPLFTLLARAYRGSPPDCVVLNTKNTAVSEYLNYGFNSMVRFNGTFLIADQNGIYEIDSSDTDEGGYKIKAHIKSGEIDTYNGNIQRLRNAWLSYESDGDLQVVTRADETITRKYSLPLQDANGIDERRVKFERGIKDRIFDFKIENVNGSSMDIESMRVMLEPIIGKKG